MEKINKKTKIGKLLVEHPEAVDILVKEGMGCMGCPVAMSETIEEGCLTHGVDCNKVIKEINGVISKKEKRIKNEHKL